MNEELRIIIADDHPIFRSGLRQIIESKKGFNVVAEAADGETALRLIQEHKPDIVILDVNMPRMSGFAVVKEMRSNQLGGEVIMLTMHNEEAMFNKAMDLGVKGYVLKDGATIDIMNCLIAVSEGQNFTSPAITTYLFKRAKRPTRGAQHKSGIDELTPTERMVLRLIAEYKTSREIADELGISYRTVENHRNNICAKLDIHGSHALIKFALQHQNEI